MFVVLLLKLTRAEKLLLIPRAAARVGETGMFLRRAADCIVVFVIRVSSEI